ncbi:MAG: type I 3-dehydroquinate dehydratase [Thermodesulfobacteriota bacterium]
MGRGQGAALPGPPPKSPFPLRLCVPVVAGTVTQARRHYLRAARKGLWAEMRLDYLDKPDLPKLFRTLPGPVVVTNRPQAEGGQWTGSEGERRRLLEEALGLGVHFLDVEWRAEPAWRRELWERRGGTRFILSWHDFSGTPDPSRLEEIFEEMLATEAQVIKMVTWAKEPEDNLRLLAMIPQARARGREIIAFCMGPLGKWSRLAAPFLGSFLTFAPLNPKQASAPGQITVNEFRRMWRILK